MINGNIFYKLGNKLYVNITNRCSCDCVFCIRRNGDSVGDAENLWLKHEPSIEEIKDAFLRQDLSDVVEIVFCGYGEPLERADTVVQIGEHIKSETTLPLRLNTNGLVKLIEPEFDLKKLRVFDSVSISLNSDNAADYQRLTRSVFGEVSFDSMLQFAKEIKPYTTVFFTVVEGFANEGINLEKCRIVSENAGVPLRVRHYEG